MASQAADYIDYAAHSEQDLDGPRAGVFSNVVELSSEHRHVLRRVV